MILSGQSIRKRGFITPFYERSKAFGMTFGLSVAGYDVRVAETLSLHPGAAYLASTIEHFNMPRDLLGMVVDKSTWARCFLAVQNTVIEPGWRGHLTLELTNHGADVIEIISGMPIAQILFLRVDEPVEAPYTGKYQDQGPEAVAAIFEDLLTTLTRGSVRVTKAVLPSLS